jgi:hypothetical protein
MFVAYGGAGYFANVCYGEYLRCDGTYQHGYQFAYGSKSISVQFYPATRANVYWYMTSKDLYWDDSCLTPNNEQGWNPVVFTHGYSSGYTVVDCN